MISVVSLIVVLGLLIFIHELGHFWVARKCGVGVEVFSVGFGPDIWSKTVGETKYRIGLIPFGGYVKMVGEEDSVSDDDTQEEGAEPVEKKVVDPELSFANKTLFQRSLIVAAGSVMNLLLAFVLFPLVYIVGVHEAKYLGSEPTVGYVVEGESAHKAGLLEGDIIKVANGKKIRNWQHLLETLILNPDKKLELKVSRNGSIITTTLIPETSEATGVGIGGFYPPMAAVAGKVYEGAASEAGMLAGDLIVAIDGEPISHWAQMTNKVANNGKEMIFTVNRNGEELNLKITPRLDTERNRYLVGIEKGEDTHIVSYGFFESISKGLTKAKELGFLLFTVLGGLFAGDYSIKTLGGPILIAEVAGDAAQTGLGNVLLLMAMLSLQLGIINLFPIPVLDGGHLVFYLAEFVRGGKPLPDIVIHYSQQVGMVLLLGLMVVVTWNDIVRIFTR